MRILIGLALLALALSANAKATPLVDDHSVNADAAAVAAANASNTNVNAPVTVNTNTAKGGDADATAVNFNANVAKGGSAHASNRNDIDVDTNIHNSNRSSNHNTNTNEQSQRQRQSQSQSQSTYSDVSDSGNSSIAWTERRQTASAYAPAVFAAAETCVQSQSAGAQTPAFGISLGFSHDNEGCNMRRNAGMLFALGQRAAAVELMCSDDDVRVAMARTGTPCAIDAGPSEMKPTAEEEAPAQRTAAVDPYRMAPIPN